MALSNDLDTSSESEYDSDLDSTTSEMDENHENVEPEHDADWDLLLNCILPNCMQSNFMQSN